METIEITVIENNGRVIDMVPTEEVEECGGIEEYPEDFDLAEDFLFPKEIWEAGDIGFRNYKKHIVKS